MKIICVGRNYVDHAKELNNEVPTEPLLFMKPSTALLINNKAFYYPGFSKNIQYEAEIVLKIKKNGRHVQPEFAAGYYDHITIGIDFTARDIQSNLKAKGHPWEIAKAFDNSAVIGKFIAIGDKDRKKIAFGLKRNGESVQSGMTGDMIFDFETLICYISSFFKLQVGDLIFTGTPAGVGPVMIGDKLEGYIGEEKLLYCEVR